VGGGVPDLRRRADPAIAFRIVQSIRLAGRLVGAGASSVVPWLPTVRTAACVPCTRRC